MRDQPSKQTHRICIKFFWIYGDDSCRSCCWFLVARSERKMVWLCGVCSSRGLSDFIVMGIKGGAKVICLMQ